MVGLHGGYYEGSFIVARKKDSDEWDYENAVKFDGIKEANFTVTMDTYNSEESNPIEVCAPQFSFSFTMTDELKAQLLGYKNANCLHRAIRRMKRKNEKERRRRLKQGVT